MVPTLLPELKTPVAKARSLLGNPSATVPLIAGLVMVNDPVFFGGVAVLALIFPSMATVMAAPGRIRVLLGVATAALSLLTAAAFTLALTGGTDAAYWLFGVVGLSGVLVGVARAAAGGGRRGLPRGRGRPARLRRQRQAP